MKISAFSCAKCQRKFETKSGMAIHFKYCINPTRKKPLVPKLHTCSICSANFRYWSQLEEHFTRHAGSKEFECRKGNCKRRFFSMPSRKKHENNCKGMNLLEVSFGQESSATCSETMEMQLPTEIRVYACKNCPRKFDTEGGLSKHAWRCKEPDQTRQLHTCEICSMEFLNAKNLDAHMNKHNGIKPYRCKNETCGMHFYGKLEMYAHGRVCGKDKPICQLCGRQLSSEVTLRAHMETHAAEPTAECETCGKKFKTKKLLKTHQAVHSDERKFSCDECGKAYKTLYALKVHRRNHMEVKPFSCTVCGKGFVYKCLVKPHMDKHHGGGD
ncbi:zinc finger protein 232 [Culex quinquefasciatus]|uniref:Zinc finger protein 232 n=1 Tax=Culex quinquefasciatus TaxID=7176 RepID=B0X7D7_CULQU|nr:zinc finger protein 232 [Culex quinquefasciatus]|eukprot:XP_001865559.1 zinc finger protein 232 [Culex quinquefasciatus]